LRIDRSGIVEEAPRILAPHDPRQFGRGVIELAIADHVDPAAGDQRLALKSGPVLTVRYRIYSSSIGIPVPCGPSNSRSSAESPRTPERSGRPKIDGGTTLFGIGSPVNSPSGVEACCRLRCTSCRDPAEAIIERIRIIGSKSRVRRSLASDASAEILAIVLLTGTPPRLHPKSAALLGRECHPAYGHRGYSRRCYL
jgi:hypothetical protein